MVIVRHPSQPMAPPPAAAFAAIAPPATPRDLPTTPPKTSNNRKTGLPRCLHCCCCAYAAATAAAASFASSAAAAAATSSCRRKNQICNLFLPINLVTLIKRGINFAFTNVGKMHSTAKRLYTVRHAKKREAKPHWTAD